MKSIQEALSLMMPAFAPRGAERVPLSEAVGRFLAERLTARSSLPPFANSAMDGYALRIEDVKGTPTRLPLAGEARAGGEIPSPLPPGSAVRIFTGAMIPSGADAVVIQEHTRAIEGAVEILQPVAPGANIRREGSDLLAGTVMLEAGARLGAGELGLLAAQGIGAVSVHRRPRVAILSTGDELRDISDPAEPGTIVGSNAYALAAQVREAGGVPEVLPNVPDDLEKTVERMREGLTADLLITCGGVSVGEYDFVKDAFTRLGIRAEFWKVRVKPGKPLTFGLWGSKPVVGLPGNPVSAMVTFEVFVRPGIRRMLGDPRPYRVAHSVVLEHAHRHSAGRPELARAAVRVDGGRLSARMLRLQGSGALPSMVGVDALVLLPADVGHFEAGTTLPAILLRDELGADRPSFDA